MHSTAGWNPPPYILEKAREAVETSCYPIAIEEQSVVEFDSEIAMAGPGRPLHRLTYSSAYRPYRDHFLLSACYKILRFWDRPEERYLPMSDGSLPEPEKGELRRTGPWSRLDAAEFDAMAAFLYRGTVRQLTSYPVDLRVEREIAEHVPEHKERQQAYLERQVLDFEPTLDPGIIAAFPEKIGRASQAMNVAFAEEAAELTGTRPGRLCREARYRPVGLTLRNHLHDVTEAGVAGDRLLTDRWAEELGVRGWYEWVEWKDQDPHGSKDAGQP